MCGHHRSYEARNQDSTVEVGQLEDYHWHETEASSFPELNGRLA
jgi:hypothetical protein